MPAHSANSPLVSIITVVKNRSGSIERTIDSVLAQTCKGIEYVIVDGGSTDGTLEIIRSRSGDGTLRWISEPDHGIYDAMNKGIDMAQGAWLYFLGADDELADPRVIEDMLASLENSPAQLLCGHVHYADGRRCASDISWRINIYNTAHHQGTFYRRALFDLFRYRSDLRIGGDYELNYLAYLRKLPMLRTDRLVARCGTGGISHTSSLSGLCIEMHRARKPHVSFLVNYGWLAVSLLNVFLTHLRRTIHGRA